MSLAGKRLGAFGLLLGACLPCVSGIRGQSDARLEGTVVDQSGAAVSGANVTFFSDERVVTIKTNEDGRFEVATIPNDTHYLEVSSVGFFPVSIPITEKTPRRLTFTLWVASFSGCLPVRSMPTPPITHPSLSYEERSEAEQLTVTVSDAAGLPLSYVPATLVKANLDAPLVTGQDSHRGFGMKERSFKETVIAKMISDDKGQFQFTNLDPGWYTLSAATDDGHSFGRVKFWIARENLTRISILFLAYAPCGY